MTRLLPLATLTLCAVLCACGRGGTPQATATPAKSLSVTLNAGSRGDQPWTSGAGTFAIFASNSTTPITAIATASVNSAGTATLALPTSATGIESKTTASPKAGLAGLSAGCASTLTETAPTAQAAYLDSAGFMSAQGGTPLREYTATVSGSMLRYPVYVTQDDTVTGQLTCGAAAYTVNLPYKRGWNVLVLTNNATSGTYTIGLDDSATLHYAVK